ATNVKQLKNKITKKGYMFEDMHNILEQISPMVDKIIKEDAAVAIKELDVGDYLVVGDGSLVGRENNYGDIPQAFLNTKKLWKKADQIAYLVPKYLKESESYYR
ncbi:MAG: hypothetical protein II568_07280, partial [Erysipelotrichaceae bacterium]|nr:hypothetical protein [Erysipelotrichaceae bacterium]